MPGIIHFRIINSHDYLFGQKTAKAWGTESYRTNFDRLRMELFQESAVYDSILDNDLYPQFANSFLVVIGQDKFETETAYIKYSNERDPRFNILTQICQKPDGSRYVQKLPTGAKAEAHVSNIL